MPLAQALTEIREASSKMKDSGLSTETSLMHDDPQ